MTLSSSKNVEKVNTDEPAPEQTIPPVRAASKPARKQVAEEPPEPFKPSRFELTEQTADVHASQPKQTAGQAQNGLLAEEDYREQLLRHLEKFKHYPFVARRQGLQGAVKMQITVNRQGKLLSVNCLSGGAMFCHAAVKSARDAEPLPDPPQSPYRLEYVMEYKLHQ